MLKVSLLEHHYHVHVTLHSPSPHRALCMPAPSPAAGSCAIVLTPVHHEQDQPWCNLRRHEIAKVAPGHARNDLVPRQSAVYAHYLNRQKYAAQIAAFEASQAGVEREDVVELKARQRDLRMIKRLRALKLVRTLLRTHPAQCQSCRRT